MSVAPASIAGIPCGTNVTVTYKATIHIAANGPGGTSSSATRSIMAVARTRPASRLPPGETSKTYSFTWSGALPADHTYPGLGGIQVTSPNQLISPTVKPRGTLRIAVSICGHRCRYGGESHLHSRIELWYLDSCHLYGHHSCCSKQPRWY